MRIERKRREKYRNTAGARANRASASGPSGSVAKLRSCSFIDTLEDRQESHLRSELEGLLASLEKRGAALKAAPSLQNLQRYRGGY